ncbi:MAG: phosphotransferase family protein [Gammaproteobacteria bacterium]
MAEVASFDADTQAVIERLREAVRRRFGSATRIGNFSQATLGGSNRTILFDLLDGSARRLVLRQETIPQDYTPFLPADIQYRILQVVHAHGVLVPPPVFELEAADELGHGYVVGAVAGESLPKRLLNEPAFTTARARFLDQAGAQLARIHAIDPGLLPALEAVPESGDPLAAWLGYYDRWNEPHPALELAFRWLERERPPRRARTLLHGDFRIGNMLVGDEGIRALLDWECAHFGDPLEDFGWLCTRSWRFEHVGRAAAGIGLRENLYRAYERAGGRAVDRAATRWWEIFGLTRWALYNVMQIHGHVSGRRRSPAFAACGRNTCLIEYDLLMTIAGKYE